MPPPNNRFNALAYVRQIAYAIGARQYALSATAAQFVPPVTGDRADSLVAAFQTALTFGWGATPDRIGTFVRPDWSMDGLNQADALGTSGNYDLSRRAYSKLPAPAAAWMAAHQGGVPTTAGLYGRLQSDAWWRRRKPRTVTSLTAMADTDGNAAAAGQVAFYNPGGSTDLYAAVYSAPNQPANAWSRDDSRQPDVLDSTRDAPNFTPPGVAQVGDYIGGYKGEHAWTEIEAITNATSTAFGTVVNTSVTARGGSSYGGGSPSPADPTLTDAEQDANAAWASSTASSTSIVRAYTGWRTDGRYFGATVDSLQGTVTDGSYNTQVGRTTRAFSLGGAYQSTEQNSHGQFLPGFAFNNLGAPVALGVYTAVGSSTGAVAFATAQPPGYPGNLGSSTAASWGFSATFATLLTFTGLSTVGSS